MAFDWAAWHEEVGQGAKDEQVEEEELVLAGRGFGERKGVSHNLRKPQGYEAIEPVMDALQHRLREAERETHVGKRAAESTWPILVITHQKSKYVYEMFRDGKIDQETFDYCADANIVSAPLIKKWMKPGYEKLCCVSCVDVKATSFGTTCICRVPRAHLEANKVVECVTCGCRGCFSKD